MRIGLFLDNGRLTAIVVRARNRLDHFTIEAAEDPARALVAEFQARELTGRGIRLGLDRRLAVVKTIELPSTAGGDLGEMVGFELERHVPFPPEDMRFDWTELPNTAEGRRRALVVACEHPVVDRLLKLVADSKRRPLALTVACHDLLTLLPRRLPANRAVWAHRHDGRADLLFLDGRTLLTSRSVAANDADELAREIRHSFPLVHWSGCDALWLSGDDTSRDLPSRNFAGLAPVSEPPYSPAARALVAALPVENLGTALLALGVAMGSRRPRLNLLPSALRPRTLSRAQVVTVVTAAIVGLLGVTLLLSQNYQKERYLDRLSLEIRHLDPEVKAVEQLSAQLRQKTQLLATLQSVQREGIRALPLLRELTDLLPHDAWIQSLSMDTQGVEIAGQASAASQLIPLLENSSGLAQVEFTSPVTKAQDKDQFRLKAAWKGQSDRAPAGVPSAGRQTGKDR